MPHPHRLGQAGTAVSADERQFFVTLIGTGPTGARIITSPDSTLVVGVAPVGELGLLLARLVFKARPLTYLMHACADHALLVAQLKIGETLDPETRFAKHFRNPPVPADEIVLVACYHDSFGKDEILALQHSLTAQAMRAGRCRVVGAPPQVSWLQTVHAGQLGRWLEELRPMLVAGGCKLLEPPGPRLRPRVEVLPDPQPDGPDLEPVSLIAPQAVPTGFRLDLPAGLLVRPDARHYALAWEHVRAEALVVDGWTILLRGSLVARTATSGIQTCIARKRQTALEAGLLKATRRRDVWRTGRDLALPTLTNAVRFATATNLPKTLWQPT